MQEASNDPAIILHPPKTATTAVIWLHGLGADGHDFAGIVEQLGFPDEHTTRFVFPHAPVQAVTINGGMEMRSWYDIRSMDLLGDVDAIGIQGSCHHIYDLIQQQIEQGIEAEKIVIAGFSQGGLIALHAALSYEKQLAGVLALSTYCPMYEQFYRHCSMPIMMTHGLMDNVIPITIAEHSMKALEHKGYKIDWKTYPMEHQLCYEEVEEMGRWLKQVLGY
ncbi:MAG: alpha/beta hydrolase-fold protein [Pseudomonadota bacterium]|nr:alpha/beta hydrolase-fold protein [Pseudomonadota bacterium]